MPILLMRIPEDVNEILEAKATEKYGGGSDSKRKAITEAIKAWVEVESLKEAVNQERSEAEKLRSEVERLKSELQARSSVSLRMVSFEDVIQHVNPALVAKLKKSSGAVKVALETAFTLYQRQLSR
ncbi:MAG: hypothetical protein QXK12_04375 [Candidatus Nezhaarchaeales archaeon]